MEEGAFLEYVQIIDVLELAHGPFQNIEYQFNHGVLTHFIFLGISNQKQLAKSRELFSGHYPVWEIPHTHDSDLVILEWEMIFNHFVNNWIRLNGIDQVEWYGKARQGIIYDLAQ